MTGTFHSWSEAQQTDFLSLVFHQQVQILEVLPNDSSRIGSESSLLITDIVVELEDHSIANVEVQKFGYFFPGQRSACYSADLLLRQYKRVRERKKQENRTFSYRDVKMCIRLFCSKPVHRSFTPRNSKIHTCIPSIQRPTPV